MSVHRDKERGTWRVALHIEDASGKLVNTTKRGFKTKSEALAWERNFLADVRETVDMTFEAFFEVYARDVKPRVRVTTWDQKEHLIKTKLIPFFGKKRLASITSKDVLAWQNSLLERAKEDGTPYSRTYLRTVDNQLSAIFNHAVRHYGLRANPVLEAGRLGEKKANEMLFWTTDEYLRFSEELADKPTHFYAFEILYWCGIREGELLALTPADIDLENGILHITKSYARLKGEDVIGPPKTSKSVRDVMLPQFLIEELREFMAYETMVEPDDRLFPFTKCALANTMKTASRAAGVKQIRVHDLRHSHVSLLINLGFPALAIADRLGHESVHITYNYAHLFPSQQQNVVDVLDALMGDQGEE